MEAEKDENVKVCIRVRPMNQKETSLGNRRCLTADGRKKTILLDAKPETKLFTFDYVADEETTQEEIFAATGKPITDSCLSGYNGTIFAYGQTGSGKSFTITGSSNLDENELMQHPQRGLMPRIFDYLFLLISRQERNNEGKIQFLCKCSFFEIYNETITDLLNPTSQGLHIREDMRTGIYVENLKHQNISSPTEALQVLRQGNLNRRVGSTDANDESSRSHSVMTIYIQSKENKDGMTSVRSSKMNIIDLAGSERQKSTNAVGLRLKEAGSINKSLSSLGNVIRSLVDVAQGLSRHVHYRDSKLTFLLKDSLGGNSKTTIIANVSPSDVQYGETLSTLKFAQRAKMVQNQVFVNEDTSGSVVQLQSQVAQLKKELYRSKALVKALNEGGVKPNQAISIQEEFTATNASNSKEISEKEEELAQIAEHVIRRNQFLDEGNKNMRVQMEKLQTIVHSYQEKLQSMKMMQSFHKSAVNPKSSIDESIKSYEKMVKELQNQIDHHPEVKKLGMENIQLKEEIRSFEERFGKENNALVCEKFNAIKYSQDLEKIFLSSREETRRLADELKNLNGESYFLLRIEKEKIEQHSSELEKSLERNKKIYEEKISTLENHCSSFQSVIHELDSLAQKQSKDHLTEKQKLEKSFASKIESLELLLREASTNSSKSQTTNEEISRLREEIEQFSLERESNNARYQSLLEENNSLKISITKAAAENNLANSIVSQKSSRCEELENQIEASLATITKLESENKSLSDKLKNEAPRISDAFNRRASLMPLPFQQHRSFDTLKLEQDLSSKEKELEEQIEEFNILKEEHEIYIQTAEYQIQQLNEVIQSLQKKSDEALELERIISTKSEALFAKDQQIEKQQQIIESMRGPSEQSQIALADIMKENGKLREEINLLIEENDRNQTHSDLKKKELEEERQKVEDLLDQLKSIKQSNSELHTSLSNSRNALSERESEYNSIQSELEEAKLFAEKTEKSNNIHANRVSSLQKELVDLKNDFIEQSESKEMEHLEKMQQVQREIEEKKDQIAGLKKREEELNEECQRLNQQMEESNVLLNHLKVQLQSASSSEQSHLQAQMEELLSKHHAEIQSMRLELQNEKKQVQSLEDEAESLDSMLQKKDAQMKELETRIDSLQDRIFQQFNESTILSEENMKVREEKEELLKQHQDHLLEVSKLRQEEADVFNECLEYKTQIGKLEEEKMNISSRLSEKTKELEIIQKQWAEEKETNEKLIGHTNSKQKIQHHIKIKKENNTLKRQMMFAQETLMKVEQEAKSKGVNLLSLKKVFDKENDLNLSNQLHAI
eukprot:TRINITY_DN6359_c0_g1_i2.p1 TRINITY_DN6359_c0_g1~~TRINITY_DN6359_c0_g1_i2.p1  ORF type:complete len:1305 (+),score=532.06 TRINITY_DN6359_c0_g1_i2:120-4034(+)